MTSGIALGLREVRRAKARFGLLGGAVGVLAFLIVFQQALLSALVTQFVGGVERQQSDVLVYAEQARVNLAASVVTDSTVDAVAAVPGVSDAGPLGVATFSALPASSSLEDATVIGHRLDGPGRPEVTDGRAAESPGEAVVSSGFGGDGFELGATVLLVPGDTELTIVGVAEGASLNVTATLFTDYDTWVEARRDLNPDAAEVTPSAVAAQIAEGGDATAVADAVNAEVPGVEALDRAAAADRTPGVESVDQSLSIILALTFTIVVVVVGFFFLILTVQKRRSLVLLRALGAPASALVTSLVTQVVLVGVTGIVVGTALAGGALQGVASGGLPARLDPGQVLTTGAAIVVFAVLASTGAIRRVLRIQPVEATVPGGQR